MVYQPLISVKRTNASSRNIKCPINSLNLIYTEMIAPAMCLKIIIRQSYELHLEIYPNNKLEELNEIWTQRILTKLDLVAAY